MKSIGFKNFRKFTDFPTIELGGINILVGGNNSGKSTLVKSMLLMRDFLKSKIQTNSHNILQTMMPVFDFNIEHVNIGNFKRAFCKSSAEGENTISFNLGLNDFIFDVSVSGDRVKDSVPQVTLIKVEDTSDNVSFIFDYHDNVMTAKFGISEQDKEDVKDYEEISSKIKDLRDLLKNTKDLEQISSLKLEIEENENILKTLDYSSSLSEETVTISGIKNHIGDNNGTLLIPELLKEFIYYAHEATTGDTKTIEYNNIEENKSILRRNSSKIKSIIEKLIRALLGKEIEYIYAHSVSQQALYSIKDSNDYSARTIHEFFTSKISHGDEEFDFIQKWMTIFEIGKDIEIKPVLGEAYQVLITDLDDVQVELADKGMGSIQMTILLLRLATLMRKYKGHKLTVLLEEPEQNLHPALQSKLAGLLYEVNKECRFQFVVETHSEYLVRNTQVIVAKEFGKQGIIEHNPFNVFYLDNKLGAYQMKYLSNGKFDRDFGTGFFDVADNASLELFDLED